MEFKRLIIAFGEWVEAEPTKDLYEKISGKKRANERSARLEEVIKKVDTLQEEVKQRLAEDILPLEVNGGSA